MARKMGFMLAGLLACPIAACGASHVEQEDDAAAVAAGVRQLLNGVAVGDRSAWVRLLDANAVYVSENNEVFVGAHILGIVHPLPKGVHATIVPSDLQIRSFGGFVVATYVAEERASYSGQQLVAKYRVMDTWRRTPAGWRLVASEVFALPQDPPRISLPPKALQEYAGRYRLPSGTTYVISLSDGQLQGQRQGDEPERLIPELRDLFFVSGSPRSRKVFKRGASGSIVALADRREGIDLTSPRID